MSYQRIFLNFPERNKSNIMDEVSRVFVGDLKVVGEGREYLIYESWDEEYEDDDFEEIRHLLDSYEVDMYYEDDNMGLYWEKGDNEEIILSKDTECPNCGENLIMGMECKNCGIIKGKE